MPRDPFERLVALLGSMPEVADWKLRQRVDRETQLYLVGERREALRTIDGDRYDVTVYVDQDGKRGASSATLLPEHHEEWADRVRAAVFRAKLQSNPPFHLPGRARCRAVALVDATIRDHPDERANEVAERLRHHVRRERGVRLSSAEVFLTYARTRFANSRGAAGADDETAADLPFVVLVDGGRLARYWATKEYADYLGVKPTGALTNIDVRPGRTPDRDLLADGPVLEVVSFSWFNPDFVTGDFACEIRLGYERRGRTVRPVRGGAVQGNLFAAFARAHFAREVGWMGTYHGPRSIRFDRLTVAGS